MQAQKRECRMILDAKTLSPVLPDDVVEAGILALQTAKDAGLTIATAESCTGGLMASLLTDIEGASAAFDRGFVVYSKRAKSQVLGLGESMIERFGAVSEPVARAMAEGAISRSDASIAMAITGFAGPAGPDDEPGLVHFACASAGQVTRHRSAHFGNIGRGATRIAALRVALDMLTASMSLAASTVGEASRQGLSGHGRYW
ncbi:MAG: CinA family protein [Sphingomonadaceae bacterium]